MDAYIRDAVTSASRYVVQNPGMIARMLAHALAFRLPIPLHAVEWLANALGNPAGDTPVSVESAAPGLAVRGTVAVMGNTMKASAVVNITEVQLAPDVFRVKLVVEDLDLVADNDSSPLAQLLKSGALDLTKPADLLKFTGKKPAVIADAHVDTFELDLLNVPAVALNESVRQALNAFTPVVTVSEIFSQDDLLLIAFQAMPGGIPHTVAAVRQFFQGR